MTSNQLAMNANMETFRHNQNVEGETNRHNLATEQLEQSAQDIEAKKNEWIKDYDQQQLAWKKEYDAAYLEMQRSQGQRKLDLEEQLNNIKSMQAENERAHLERMDQINRDQATIQQQLANEQERHNKELESFNSKTIEQEAYRNSLIAEQNALTQFRNYSDYVLGVRQAGVNSRNASTNEAKYQLDRARQEALLSAEVTELKTRSAQEVMNGISALAHGASSVINSFRGGQNGSKKTNTQQQIAGKLTKEVAEHLLFQ